MEKQNKFSEFGFIAKLATRFASSSSEVVLGIGDDAALLKGPSAGHLVTVDMLMEGVHFDLSYFEPEDVGFKSLAVNLSDIAAMGGEPKFILASLGIRDGLNAEFMDRLFDGFELLTKTYGVTLVGGNLTKSPHSLVIDVVAMGTPVASPFLRSGAKTGDVVAVTGNLGSAAAGFHVLKRLGRAAVNSHPEIALAQLRPQPRIKEGMALAKWGGVTSAIDVSDGLASELGHLARASGVGFLIEEANLPVSLATKTYTTEQKQDLAQWLLHSGEDYELLFTFDPKAGRPPIAFQQIGQVVENGLGILIQRNSGRRDALKLEGWNHFKL